MAAEDSGGTVTTEGTEGTEMEGKDTEITERVLGAAIAVHRALGPGLLESACEACLAYELIERGLRVERQTALPVIYREVRIDCGYRLDLVVGGTALIEVKAVERLLPVHDAQVLTYLKLAGLRVGLISNYNVPMMRDGIRRFVRDPSP